MADPLSIAASAIALTKTSQTCVTLLIDLIKCVHNAPAEIHALSNEITELGTYFDDFELVCENISTSGSQQSILLLSARKPLENAREALTELEELLKQSNLKPSGPERRLKWLVQRRKVRRLRETFQKIKSELIGVLMLSTASAT